MVDIAASWKASLEQLDRERVKNERLRKELDEANTVIALQEKQIERLRAKLREEDTC